MKKIKSKNTATRDKQGSPTPSTTDPSSAPRWLLLIFCLAVSAGGTYFVLTTYVWPPIPEAVAGTWDVKGGEMDGTRMTINRDGGFFSVATIDGRDVPIKARVELIGDTLRFVIVDRHTGREEAKIQTIQSLTDTEMIVEEGGATSRLVRVK